MPLSKHSIAQAMVPPALIVSIPDSSQNRVARIIVLGVGHPHQRPEREGALVLHTAGGAGPVIVGFEDLLASDRAVGTVSVLDVVRLVQSLSADRLGSFEGRLPEVQRRESAQAIEDRDVGDCPQGAVLFRSRAEASPSKVVACDVKPLGVGHRHSAGPADGDGL